MIPLIQREIVIKKKWMLDSELMDVLIIAESTPGPVSVNTATYVGYKTAGVFGAFVSTLGLVLPSFIIIFIISLFYDDFIKIKWVQSAFLGIQAAVAVLIISAGYKLFKSCPKTIYSIIAMVITLILSLLFKFFSISFSSIYFILIGALIGICFYLVERFTSKDKDRVYEVNNESREKQVAEPSDSNEEDKG